MIKKICFLFFTFFSLNSFSFEKLNKNSDEHDTQFSHLCYKKNDFKYNQKNIYQLKKQTFKKDSEALNQLGCLYLERKDYANAYRIFNEASNNSEAQTNLAKILLNKQYGKIDTQKAIESFRIAMGEFEKDKDLKFYPAAIELSLFYQNSEHPDYQNAEQFLLKANTKKNAMSTYALAHLYLNNNFKHYSSDTPFSLYTYLANLPPDKPSDIDSEYQSLEEYKHLINMSYIQLGSFYEEGKIVKSDYKKAISWYLKAFNNGDAYSANRIGTLFFDGKIVQKNYKEAFAWFLRGSEHGDLYSKYMLGIYYLCIANTSINSNYFMQGKELIELSKIKNYIPNTNQEKNPCEQLN